MGGKAEQMSRPISASPKDDVAFCRQRMELGRCRTGQSRSTLSARARERNHAGGAILQSRRCAHRICRCSDSTARRIPRKGSLRWHLWFGLARVLSRPNQLSSWNRRRPDTGSRILRDRPRSACWRRSCSWNPCSDVYCYCHSCCQLARFVFMRPFFYREPIYGCNKCPSCKRGRPATCENFEHGIDMCQSLPLKTPETAGLRSLESFHSFRRRLHQSGRSCYFR